MTHAAPTLWHRLWYTRLRDVLRGRFDASLYWKQSLAEADLPPEVEQTVCDTVGRTRLWRREKVSVTRDLAAHFQDGLDTGQSAQQLIESFGDPRVAARLIRRAKRRCRPIAWHVFHYGWMTLAAIAALYLLAALYMVTGRPTIKVDYLAILNERALATPEAERAWPLYREALLAMGAKATDAGGAVHTNRFYQAAEATPGDEHWEASVEFLAAHQDALAQIRQAAARPGLGLATGPSWRWFAPEDRRLFGMSPDPTESDAREKLEDRVLVSTLLMHVNFLRSTARLLQNDCRRAAEAGDGDTALADVVAMLGVSRHCQEMPFLVSLLAGSNIHRMADAAVRDVLTARPDLWSDDQLRDLAHQIAAATIDWRRGIEAETAWFHDAVQRVYTDDGGGDGRLAFWVSGDQNVFSASNSILTGHAISPGSAWNNDSLAFLALPAANFAIASRQDMISRYAQLMNAALASIDTPLWQRPTILQQDQTLSAQRRTFGRFRYLIIELLIPGYDQLKKHIELVAGEREGVLVGLVMELYRREEGRWPDSLEELSPRGLPELPPDRITGGPLRYAVVDDRPVVYSVGVDRNDDGGREPTREPELASPRFYQEEPAIDDTHDGDWVVWSTLEPPQPEEVEEPAEQNGAAEPDDLEAALEPEVAVEPDQPGSE